MISYLHVCLFAIAALPTALGVGLGDLPDCARPCATSLPSECSVVDIKCICSSSTWISGISCCVKTKCSDTDQQTTIQIAIELCKSAKVTVPTAASCAADATATGGSIVSSTGSTSAKSISVQSASSVALASSAASSSTIVSSSSVVSGSSSGSAASKQSSSSSVSASQNSATATTAGSSSAVRQSSSSARATSTGTSAGQRIEQGIGAAGAAALALVLL